MASPSQYGVVSSSSDGGVDRTRKPTHMNRGARFAIALAGLVATPIYWALVLFKVFVLVMAECGPGPVEFLHAGPGLGLW